MDSRHAYQILKWMLEQVREGTSVELEADWADGEHYAWTLNVKPAEGPMWHTHCHIFEPTLDEAAHALWQQVVGGSGLSRVEQPTVREPDPTMEGCNCGDPECPKKWQADQEVES